MIKYINSCVCALCVPSDSSRWWLLKTSFQATDDMRSRMCYAWSHCFGSSPPMNCVKDFCWFVFAHWVNCERCENALRTKCGSKNRAHFNKGKLNKCCGTSNYTDFVPWSLVITHTHTHNRRPLQLVSMDCRNSNILRLLRSQHNIYDTFLCESISGASCCGHKVMGEMHVIYGAASQAFCWRRHQPSRLFTLRRDSPLFWFWIVLSSLTECWIMLS